MRKALVTASLAALLLALPVLVPAVKAAEPVYEKIKLAYADPNALVRLFAGDAGKKPANEAEEMEAKRQNVVPKGIQALLGYPLDRSLIVKGTPEALEQFKRGIHVADVERVDLGNGRARVVLTPEKRNVERLDRAVRALPGAGMVAVKDSHLTLEGPDAWVDASLRAAIRLELAEAPAKPQQ